MAKKRSSSKAWLKEHREDPYVQQAQRDAGPYAGGMIEPLADMGRAYQLFNRHSDAARFTSVPTVSLNHLTTFKHVD